MFILLESQDVIALDRVVALIKNDLGAAVVMDDGRRRMSVFRPETLRRRLFPKGPIRQVGTEGELSI